jgi:signal transduction histidine kinase
METNHRDSSWHIASLDSRFRIYLLACLVATLSYLAARLGGTLEILPQADWPLWPGNVLVASILLFVPRRIWPILMAAAFAAFVLFNLQSGVPIRSIVLLLLSDSVEILTVALGLRYSFGGVPQLNSVKALAKYSFFAAFLAPSAGAIFGAFATSGNYWTSWRISFFSEAIAYLTIMPAILGWVSQARAWARASRAYYLEATVLIATIISLSYFVFVAHWARTLPALLYFLVPFLLWSALRFGSAGAGTSATIVAFLSVWGAAHGRGPFTETAPINNVLWLQLFLLSTAVPFMVLAALVEERKQAEKELRESEERLLLAVQAGRMYVFEWDAVTDVIVRSGECADIFNWMDDLTRDTGRRFAARVHPDDREAYAATETGLTSGNPTYQTTYRVLLPDGSLIWLEESGRAFFDGQDRMLRTIGMVADVTERKLAEEALSSVSRRLIEAQEQERARIARELHDDLSQRMALLSVSLGQFEQGMPDLSSKTRQQVHNIGEVVKEVSSNIHNLSHQLHPSKLDTLGLVAAVGGFCRELSDQHDLQVLFVHSDIPGQIPKDVTLCFFRIVQEALRNIVKHSGAAEAKVELSGHDDQIDLCISDSGAGFSPESANGDAGLGLISMRERVRLVSGHLSVESEPSHGTRIRVRVPLFTTREGVTSEEKAHKAGA